MKILLLPMEIANSARRLTQALKRIGFEAQSITYPRGTFDFEADSIIKPGNEMHYFIWALEKFDVFHYIWQPLLPLGYDLRILKLLKKRIILHCVGSDFRIIRLESDRNPYFALTGERAEGHTAENVIREKMKFWAEITDGEILSYGQLNQSVEQCFNKIHRYEAWVDIPQSKFYPNLESKKLRIIHAPSNVAVKGTVYIEKALEKLASKGLSFEYVRVHGVKHSEALAMYKTADLIVDQILVGAHGGFACEAMALGKPVICYLAPYNDYPHDIPIINANPDNILEVLEEWLTAPRERLFQQGVKSREYAEKYHNVNDWAKKMLRIYRNEFSFGENTIIDWHKMGVDY